MTMTYHPTLVAKKSNLLLPRARSIRQSSSRSIRQSSLNENVLVQVRDPSIKECNDRFLEAGTPAHDCFDTINSSRGLLGRFVRSISQGEKSIFDVAIGTCYLPQDGYVPNQLNFCSHETSDFGPQLDGTADRPFPSKPKNTNTIHVERKRPRRTQNPSDLSRYSSPDRFLSSHSTLAQSPNESFRISIDPSLLSTEERRLRHGSASPDPFRPARASKIRALQRITPGQSTRNASSDLNVTRLNDGRSTSAGAIWNIGGLPPGNDVGPPRAVSNGRYGMFRSGSNAPIYEAQFLDKHKQEAEDDIRFRRCLGAAMNVDETSRIFPQAYSSSSNSRLHQTLRSASGGHILSAWPDLRVTSKDDGALLDAPGLRDDFYCTILAYCPKMHTLATGLAEKVYLWSEERGVQAISDNDRHLVAFHVTSLAFSSLQGGKSILAIGRNDGRLSLRSLLNENDVRVKTRLPNAITCVGWRPVTSTRQSSKFNTLVPMEDLLVGDETGDIYYCGVEWPDRLQADTHGWAGNIQLLAKISVHSQQICGIAWAQDGDYFATGGNDNACCLFEIQDVLTDIKRRQAANIGRSCAIAGQHSNLERPKLSTAKLAMPMDVEFSPRDLFSFPAMTEFIARSLTAIPSGKSYRLIEKGCEKRKWMHGAAVKAIAFCPWQRGLVAAGGGSNDRAIHFYHIHSGACLATISVHAQITSLIWSTTKREIAATFGYAQPDHPYRLAVFSWPECKQIVAIAWQNHMRALFAIAYAGGPTDQRSKNHGGHKRNSTVMGGTWSSRTADEGCLVVACSDESVKFHEIWAGSSKRPAMSAYGSLGGSPILEDLSSLHSHDVNPIR